MYNLFISHSWTYGNQYNGLVEMLNSDRSFEYKNYSVPKDDPIHSCGTDKDLYDAIKNKIEPCSVILILAGVYATYSKWINNEIKIATSGFSNRKPIIAIEYWGSKNTSTFVKDNANIVVKWNTRSIIDAIKTCA